jgi:hypothetical protein
MGQNTEAQLTLVLAISLLYEEDWPGLTMIYSLLPIGIKIKWIALICLCLTKKRNKSKKPSGC